MRQLFVSYSFALGGAERILLDLVPALEEPPALACPTGPLADRARAMGLDVHTVHAGKLELRSSLRARLAAPLHLAAQARELRRLTDELAPRRVVAWGMRALLATDAALTASRPRPKLAFQHNDFVPGPLIGAALRRAARRARPVVCLSRAVAADLDPRGRLEPPAQVLHPGVDLERFEPEGPPAAGAEVVVLGALVSWKRPDLALEIAARAAARLPELRLTFVGATLIPDEALLQGLRARAEGPDLRGRVRFAGPSGDVAAALAQASCLLHCADREPFGLALAEALACGRPVVAPAAGGPAEIVDPSCGRLYAPGDADAGASALEEVLADASVTEALGASARERARERFGLERARERFRELIAL